MRQPISSGLSRRPRYLYTIVSVAAVLFLLGFFGLLMLQIRQLTTSLKEQVDIIIELAPETDSLRHDSVAELLHRSPFVKAGSVQFTSRDEALELMSEELGEDLLALDMPNPLYDVFTFNVPASYLAPDSLTQIRTVIMQHPLVNDVFYQESLVDQIARNARRLSWILLAIALFFIALALTVIHNTIRLALYANRFIIKTQELVGATWEFISRPYLRKALWHGALSGLLACAILSLLQWWLQEQLPELKELFSATAFGALFLGLILLGMIINWLSTYYVVRRYLRMRVDELY
ncbi:MAG: permease-like cell division protein FtsX [Lewinella sp.]|nr:permease-like cell division protein FtsX [Lewinella sp.]